MFLIIPFLYPFDFLSCLSLPLRLLYFTYIDLCIYFIFLVSLFLVIFNIFQKTDWTVVSHPRVARKLNWLNCGCFFACGLSTGQPFPCRCAHNSCLFVCFLASGLGTDCFLPAGSAAQTLVGEGGTGGRQWRHWLAPLWRHCRRHGAIDNLVAACCTLVCLLLLASLLPR